MLGAGLVGNNAVVIHIVVHSGRDYFLQGQAITVVATGGLAGLIPPFAKEK